MGHRRVAIFWTDENTHPWLLSEFLEGRLRQGWGAPGMHLTENGILLDLDRWSANFAAEASKQWNWNLGINDCRNRYRILRRLGDLRKGDLVVVPRMPRQEEFTIAKVGQGYMFDDSQFHRVKDFGHVVQVEKDSLRSFGYRSSPETAAIAAKFRHYRSAVNNIQDAEYAAKIQDLYAASIRQGG
jgi:hypothetical protein